MPERLMRTEASIRAGEMFEWDRWSREIPALRFPSDCEVRIIPPFLCAVIRFIVIKGTRSISVYFDAYSALGAVWEPYWEIYPASDGETARFLLGEEEEMMQEIVKALDSKGVVNEKPLPMEFDVKSTRKFRLEER